MRWFDAALKFQGFPIEEAVRHLEAVRGLGVEGFLRHQEQKKWEILDYHKKHNAFYRSLLQARGLEKVSDWQQLPIITKAMLQRPLQERLSDGFTEKNVYLNNTSGSSGTPFFFAKDKFCHALTWASSKELFSWHGIDFNTSWQARFYGIPLSRLKYYKEKLKDRLGHRIRFPVFNLADEVCAGYVQKFKQTPFNYLNGYASSLVLFAKYCVKQNIVLKEICPSLQICVTTSEMCGPEDRKIMEAGFGIRVVNEYGAAELGLLAFEDASGDWLLNEETVLIEVVDDDGQPVQPGQSGRIVVTDLYNKATPMIRYELGDIGVIKPGGYKGRYRILQQLVGRTNDVAILPSGRKAPGLTFYYVTKGLLEQGGTMKEFVIKQVSAVGFVLEYVADAEITSREQVKVREMMDTYLEPGLELTFERKEHIQRTKAGKLRQFQNLVGKNQPF